MGFVKESLRQFRYSHISMEVMWRKQVIEVYKILQFHKQHRRLLTLVFILYHKKSFDLLIFTGNIKNFIVTVNGYQKQ